MSGHQAGLWRAEQRDLRAIEDVTGQQVAVSRSYGRYFAETVGAGRWQWAIGRSRTAAVRSLRETVQQEASDADR